ncbi:MAG TPA: nuclear transport factor 2 family protein [Sphingomicrobium sp.]|jgi:hypothetical protein|nr:nuclear transport factor 2 family protein [Sphingomicrobium sp.]
MGGTGSEARIIAALDARHAAAGAAFGNRDIDAYGALFSNALRYEASDGKVIGKGQLMRDVQAQFRRIDRAESSFARAGLVIEGGTVTETLIQRAECRASAFGLVRRTWIVERRGRYTWAREDGQWRITHVRVVDEKLRSTWNLLPVRRA